MCNHKNITIIPTPETSWGIADTYNIKCSSCNLLLHENIPFGEVNQYIKKINPTQLYAPDLN